MSRTKQKILGTLGRATLLAIADGEEFTLPERRALAPIRQTLSRKRSLLLETVLDYLSRDELKEACRALGLDDSGRAKEPIAQRILASESGAEPKTPKPAAVAKAAPKRSKRVAKKVPTNGQNGRKLTLQQLERHLFGAADILRGKMDASEFKEYIFGMLFLKRCSDQFDARREQIIEEQVAKGRTPKQAEQRADSPAYYTDAFFVPEKARWRWLHDELTKNVGDGLNKALSALSESNSGLEGVLHHIDFTRTVGKSRLDDKKLLELIKHFNRYRLRNEDFEFPDLLGAAYEYLIGEFADSAGKKGGEFYTPRPVVRMMTRLTKPTEGMRIYDPCSGSGGMLILSAEYVDEHGGNPRNLGLYGQEDNGGVWSISKMNMILHGIKDAQLENGDTLGNPLHKERGGELARFDLVLSNPPFSQNYSAEGIPFPERFKYGWCPESGKKADLMFVQHMVAVLNDKGTACTVMPHGVLFRGGAEKEIRAGFIKDDVLDAVIGLAQNLFYGTGIPACILVLRAKGSKPRHRKGKVLFINADADFRAGRAQNYLEPEHIEKIVSAYERYENIPGFAKVVSHQDLENNDYNLNIRRYADNAPPPEPHDVRAHLVGGIPKTEVEAKQAMFEAHGFNATNAANAEVVRRRLGSLGRGLQSLKHNEPVIVDQGTPKTLLVERDEHYYDFAQNLADKADIKKRIESDTGVKARENELDAEFERWWRAQEEHLIALPQTKQLIRLRRDLLASFSKALEPVAILDKYKVAGVVASWWGEVIFDLKALMARDVEGLVESWVTSIITGLEAEKSKIDPLDHKLVKRLLPEFLDEIAEAEGTVAELESRIKTAPSGEDEDTEGDFEENDDALSEEEVRALKKQLAAARRKTKTLRHGFAERLQAAHAELTQGEAQKLVLGILKSDLERELAESLTASRQAIVEVVENWWDKYRTTLRDMERRRATASAQLERFLKELGYAI